MTAELFWLLLTALLAASLWIPFIVGSARSPANTGDFTRPTDPALHPAWVHRAFRAHVNLIEQLMPFAVVVLLANMVGVSTTLTVWASAAFFWLRVAHAVTMIGNIRQNPVRPLIFTAAWLCVVAIGVQVLISG